MELFGAFASVGLERPAELSKERRVTFQYRLVR